MVNLVAQIILDLTSLFCLSSSMSPKSKKLLSLVSVERLQIYSAVKIAERYLRDGKYDSAIAILRTEADKLRGEKELYRLLK